LSSAAVRAFSDSRRAALWSYDREGWREGVSASLENDARPLPRCTPDSRCRFPFAVRSMAIPELQTDDTLQNTRDEFFARVGYAITRWAHVDRCLFALCDYAIGANKEMASAIFYKSPNIGDHLSLANVLLAYSVDEGNKKTWSELYLRIEELLPFRNELAHNPPSQNVSLKVAVDVGPKAPPAEIVAALPNASVGIPDIYWSIRTEGNKLLHKKKRSKNSDIRKEEIVTHIEDVNKLIKSLRAFEASLPQPRVLTPAKSSPPTPPGGSKRG
jgi:hypothetical protein